MVSFKEKVRGDAFSVAPDLLVKARGGDSVGRSKLGIEEPLLAAQDDDGLRDVLDGHKGRAAGRDLRRVPTLRIGEHQVARRSSFETELVAVGMSANRFPPRRLLAPETRTPFTPNAAAWQPNAGLEK